MFRRYTNRVTAAALVSSASAAAAPSAASMLGTAPSVATAVAPAFTATPAIMRMNSTEGAAKPAAETAAPPPPPPAPKAAPKPVKKSGVDFDDFLGARKWDVIKCGEHVRVYVDSYTFAWIVMDRAGSSANALGEAFGMAVKDAFEIVEKLIAEKKARIAILASAKDTFCVGADIEQLYPMTDPSLGEKVSREGQELFNRLEASKFPVIAAINGMALGGGFEIALACHHRLIASDKGAVGLPECLLGVLPGAGGCYRLPRLAGLQTAVTWILASAPQKADRAKKAGTVDAVVPSGDRFVGEYRFLEGVRAWAGRLVDRPVKPAKRKTPGYMARFLENTSIGRGIVANQAVKMLNKRTNGKYLAQYKALETLLYSASHKAHDSYVNEAKNFSELLVTPECKNQMALYFLDDSMKKVELKTGLPKEKVPDVKTIGVIGAGVMGSGIVHYFANKGYKVHVKDMSQEAVDKGLGLVKGEFQQAIKKKKLDEAGLAKKMSLIKGGTTDDLFKDCEVIVEAAVEVMDIKKKLLQTLENTGILDGKKLFATNTSSLSLTDLATVSKYPQTIVGMHFFNPVSRMPLVEVIKGAKTSKEAAAIIFNLSSKTGKKPIIVNDGPGFLVNRILGVYMAEAGRLVADDRADPHRVDQTMLKFGMPMGPFRLLDEVGLDVATHVGPVLQNGLKHDRFAVHSSINQLVKDGYLGKKNKKGLYRYEGDKAVGMNTSLTTKYLGGSFDTSFSVNDIVDRCVLLMVNEAAMILQEGIALSPEDADIGMVWGTGFPPFRGGLLQHADHRGAKAIVDRLAELESKTKSDRFKPAKLLVDHAKNGTRFFPNRPFVPYVERTGFPAVKKY